MSKVNPETEPERIARLEWEIDRELERQEFEKLKRFRAEKEARDKLDGGSAFPSHGSMGEVAHRGMTLRDWFAGRIAAIILSGKEGWRDDQIAELAYRVADAMLVERAKKTT